MPSLEENRRRWLEYHWQDGGEEWSEVWGGTTPLWWGTILPRIQAMLPAGHALEIAPGYGRITQYLKDYCRQLTIVDMTERCIEACRARFRDATHLRYHVNDGRDLQFIPDHSVDLVFSFDSLVHVEAEIIRAYVEQLPGKMAPHGIGFIHHSNIGAYRDAESGKIDCVNPHWRAESMSAALFREFCGQSGLCCISQEVVNWGVEPLTDCFSVFVPQDSLLARETRIWENGRLMDEALGLAKLARLYYRD